MEDQARDVPAPLPLSADEKRILDLYDRLHQLQLEIALMTARRNYDPDTTSPKSQADLQTELLDARSRYTLRNDVVASVLSANPTLQAVHNGTKASPIERDLLPILQRRDTTSTTLARASQTRATILSDLTETTSSSLSLHRDNAALASELLSLAAQSTAGRDAAMADPAHAPEIARLETEVRSSRQRWRVAKGTASAVVAGSGVDWARDLQLRSIVLDEEDDDM